MRRIRSTALTIGLAFAALTLPANAQNTQTDLLVAGRALGFIDNLKQNSAVRVGIAYDPANAQSAQQAAELNAMSANGLSIGGLVFRPVMVPLARLDSASVEVFFLTDGLGAEASRVARISRARKIPCITFDLSQVRDGNCAMGVRARPRVEVLVNRAAADATGIKLAAAFRFMITEIEGHETQ